jgi:CheY-like chemotaxis protein
METASSLMQACHSFVMPWRSVSLNYFLHAIDKLIHSVRLISGTRGTTLYRAVVAGSIQGHSIMDQKKILIVDDEENLRFLYDQELQEEGYQTVLAKDGFDCLEKIKTENPDLIILDIRMPRMDGLEAIGKIININKNIPIIINSAYSNYKDDFMSWAADAYVVKSYDLDTLKKTIQEVFDKKNVPA